MQRAAGLLCSSGKHAGRRGIGSLQRVEAKFRLGVCMLQQMHQFQRVVRLRLRRALTPSAQQFRRLGLLGAVVGWFRSLAAAAPQHVVNQGQPASTGHRQNFVQAIGVERGERRFGRVVAPHVETPNSRP